ncbi:ECF transporter S component [Streptomonospora sp. S1-112]|uniref:ECF transporter S component n=1 Tax=Streptomonospora mangrovi TaxID=2883123 RepID=A0A9X3NJP1_9ACTN|nr:ECF transporter S component [Streptomonospora mangrovi]MDA0563064.1 ECF transporter S component [Streptomonospora mangrovi]
MKEPAPHSRPDQPVQSGRPAPDGVRTPLRYRTVDIVVPAVLGVAIGVVFWLWNMVWTVTTPVFAFFPPAQALIYGVWLLPGVLGGLIVRKPGVAVLTSTAAAAVSMVLGGPWGVEIVLAGFVQGLLSELVFAAARYRRWGLPTAVLAAAAGGLAPAVWDNVRYYVTWPLSYQLAFGVIVVLSAALIGGVGARLLTSALARAGALAPFPSARG